MPMATTVPGAPCMRRATSSLAMPATGAPSTETITSPDRMPAWSAGEPSVADTTRNWLRPPSTSMPMPTYSPLFSRPTSRMASLSR